MSNDIQTARRRLNILQLLNEDPDYSANETLVQELLEFCGYGVSMDVVRTDLAWLEEQSLLSLRDVAGCKIATLRSRGVDAAKGVSIVPGIARPRPA